MPRLIKFICQNCGTKLAVPQEMAGVSDNCPKCGQQVTSPTLEAWQASLTTLQKPAPKPAGWSTAELADALNPPAPQPIPRKETLPKPTPQSVPAPQPQVVIQQKPLTPIASPKAEYPVPPAPPEPTKEIVEKRRSPGPLHQEPEPSSPTPPDPPDDAAPSLLSRMLKGPKLSEKTLPPTSLRQSPLAPPPPQPETPSPPPAPEDPTDANSAEDDPFDTPKSSYKSPHTPGMGELLAAVSSPSDQATRGHRATPFLSDQELRKSKSKRRSGWAKFFTVLIYVLGFEALLLLIFHKQVIPFWNNEIVPLFTSRTASQPQRPATPATPPASPSRSTKTAPPPQAPAATTPPPPTPAKPTTEATPVPQAIPITEEQLAKLPSSSTTVTPNAPHPSQSPPASSPSPLSFTPPAVPDAPYAVSDAWVFGPPAPTPATTPSPPSPAIETAPIPDPNAPIGGLPPPPADMALPNGAPPPGSEPVSKPTAAAAAPAPAPASSAPTHIGTIPAAAKTAFDSLQSFLNAPDWKTRAKYSMRAPQLTGPMAQHAADYGDGPIIVSNIDFLERHAKTPNATPYCMFELHGGQLPHRILALVSQPAKGPALVDWESFMEFRHDYLLKFLENPNAPRQQFRVMLRRKHYFLQDVGDIDNKESFQVTQPNLDHKFEGNVFVQKGTTLSTSLGTQLGWGMDMPVIVELAWRTNNKHSWVEILSIPHYGWRNS